MGHMSEFPQENPSVPRLNPFAFPSDTTFRFGLLVIFLLSGTARFAGNNWSLFRSAENRASAVCAQALLQEIYHNSIPLNLPSTVHLAERAQSELVPHLLSCTALLWPKTEFVIATILLTIAITLIVYSALPWLKRLRQQLVPVTASDLPEFVPELDRLCDQARLVRRPVFVWNPLSSAQPLAFGSWGRSYVALSGGFVARCFAADVASFRAIVLHELAHVRNGDIGKTHAYPVNADSYNM
jgi:Zn-dependent protease with chaperone function